MTRHFLQPFIAGFAPDGTAVCPRDWVKPESDVV